MVDWKEQAKSTNQIVNGLKEDSNGGRDYDELSKKWVPLDVAEKEIRIKNEMHKIQIEMNKTLAKEVQRLKKETFELTKKCAIISLQRNDLLKERNKLLAEKKRFEDWIKKMLCHCEGNIQCYYCKQINEFKRQKK